MRISARGVPSLHCVPRVFEETFKAIDRPRKRKNNCSVNCSTGAVADRTAAPEFVWSKLAPGKSLALTSNVALGVDVEFRNVRSGITLDTNINLSLIHI